MLYDYLYTLLILFVVGLVFLVLWEPFNQIQATLTEQDIDYQAHKEYYDNITLLYKYSPIAIMIGALLYFIIRATRREPHLGYYE